MYIYTKMLDHVTPTRIGAVTCKGCHYALYRELSHQSATQLIAFSQDDTDTVLHQNTRDATRFTKEHLHTWLAKERCMYTLMDGDILAAVIWHGPAQPPSTNSTDFSSRECDTIAFRSYKPYRGLGLMHPFAQLVLCSYLGTRPHNTLWLEVDKNNLQAIELYKKLSFKTFSSRKSASRILMRWRHA